MSAINQAQQSSIRVQSGGICFDFDNDDLLFQLANRSVIDPALFSDGNYYYSLPEREAIRATLINSLELIRHLDANLEALINLVVSSIFCFPTNDSEGGTSSNFIGLIRLSPKPNWSIEHFAENIVHETVHNCLFLEDMVHTIFPAPGEMNVEDALVTSALRHTPRAIDKSFHSACVAAALMYFYHLSGNEAQADSYLLPLRLTINELITKNESLRQNGRIYLSENGCKILQELQQFSITLDYDSIASLLQV